MLDDDGEITIEANPGTLTLSKLRTYRECGINRLSMGVQSLDDSLLKALGRIHTKADFLENYEAARKAGFANINLDLMFGLPGQSAAQWQNTLDEAVGLRPEHLSFYSLQLEEGTPFFEEYRSGALELPTDEEDRRMYHEAIGRLRNAGYEHYEISNSSLPGYACRHNLKYWSFEPYIGVGLGAHSFDPETGRRCNTADFERYLELTGSGQLPTDPDGYEEASLKESMGEYMFTGLRKAEGISFREFGETFGADFFAAYENISDRLKEYARDGLIRTDGGRLRLTERGIDISNKIMAEFV